MLTFKVKENVLKHFKSKTLVMIGLLAMLTMIVAGCDGLFQAADKPTAPEINPQLNKQESEVIYTGNETPEGIIANYRSLVDANVIEPFNEDQLQEMVAAYREYSGVSYLPKTAGSTIIAYTAHYVWSGSDNDLWLEYKWWAGSPQAYHFETPIWSLYWAIRVCYGGRISNWWWMEGSYQRVTGVVGSCVYVPFGSGFVRYYLRIVSR